MALIVQKFGGTSVGDVERIKNVARRVAQARAGGHDVVVVVSAMAGETDRLIGLAQKVADRPNERELDVILATGEQVSIGLLSLALHGLGQRARSFTGGQVRIQTDDVHTKARIVSIDSERVRQALAEGEIVIVAGFQGVSAEDEITTLGRGGSDLTAVAMAAALQADVCEIYTDVDGVYTTDPNIVSEARKLDRISYDEMLELASLGAKVLQTRSVEYAKNYLVPVHVRSSFNDNPGTMVVKEDAAMEKVVVSGIAYNKQEAMDRVSMMKAATIWGAEQVLNEKNIGSLEPGKLADFIVIDKDFFTIPEDQIHTIKTLLTAVGGKTVFKDTAF